LDQQHKYPTTECSPITLKAVALNYLNCETSLNLEIDI